MLLAQQRVHKSVFVLCQVTVLTSVNIVLDLPLEEILDCVFTTFLADRSVSATGWLTNTICTNVLPPVLYL